MIAGMVASFAAKFFLDQQIWPDIWELTQENNLTNANIAKDHFQSVQICNDTCEISITKKNRLNVPYVTDVLDNKPIWIGIWKSMRLAQTQLI